MASKDERMDLAAACVEIANQLLSRGNRDNASLGAHLHRLAKELHESVTTSRERERARMRIVAMSDAHEMHKGRRRGVKPPTHKDCY